MGSRIGFCVEDKNGRSQILMNKIDKMVRKIKPFWLVCLFMIVVFLYGSLFEVLGNWKYAFFPFWLAVGWFGSQLKWKDSTARLEAV